MHCYASKYITKSDVYLETILNEMYYHDLICALLKCAQFPLYSHIKRDTQDRKNCLKYKI